MRLRKREEWNPSDLLTRQLAMNPQTLQTLEECGVTESTELTLEFAFDAPGKAQAEELAAFLARETDYDVRNSGDRVEGSTQPTRVNREFLDQWVEWMIVAGYENGRSEFDGWGAAVPSK